MRHVVDVLRWGDNETIRSFRHNELSTCGIGNDHAEWTSLFRPLIHRGYLVQDNARYSILKLTPESRPLQKENQRWSWPGCGYGNAIATNASCGAG